MARAGASADAGAWSGSSGLEGLGRGSRVWFARGPQQWSGGAVQAVGPTAWVIRADEGDEVNVPVNAIQPANPTVMERVEDLTQLSYLNEPSILHDLRLRYGSDAIYTRAGPVLVAVNPFKVSLLPASPPRSSASSPSPISPFPDLLPLC